MYNRRPNRRFQPREKICRFCARQVKSIDYKESSLLRNYMSEGGKILPSIFTGNCSKHQRQLTLAIKRARHLALVPYLSR